METVGNTSVEVSECAMSSETQHFWYRNALDISPAITQPEGIKWWMFLSLFTAWLTVYLVTMKGIKSSGKVVYFTALFPYLVLTIFFIRGITLKGAGAGLAHMFYPKVRMDYETCIFAYHVEAAYVHIFKVMEPKYLTVRMT